MADFPHLKLPVKVEGIAKPSGGGGGGGEQQATINNRNNRGQHGQYLSGTSQTIVSNHDNEIQQKKAAGIDIPNEIDIPVFLQVDANTFKTDSLVNWGIEIISEEESGFIIGASVDNLKKFQENIDEFINEKGTYKNTAAKIWNLATGNDWRLNLLKGELARIWGQIDDNAIYIVELGVSCSVVNKKEYPLKNDFDSEVKFIEKLEEYKRHERELWELRDNRQREREEEIETYVAFYKGELTDIWDNEVDAIFFKVSINGKGLKDIVLTYQYLFEAQFSPTYITENELNNLNVLDGVTITAPVEGSAKVCVIDSGIQENHRLISPAIETVNSRSYVEGDPSTADHVRRSGHGTKVAGAILYPYAVPAEGTYQLESIIQNARILDSRNKISDRRLSPSLMNQIVSDYLPTRIYNLSVAEDCSYTGIHMSPLAASIDKLIHENDIVFIISAGNLYLNNSDPANLGINNHLAAGSDYPIYLNQNSSKIACPAISSFAITVGSVGKEDFENDDYVSVGGKNGIAPFSRTGLGMWSAIKPDVVEFGGDLARNKTAVEIKPIDETSIHVVNSTLHGSSATGKDFGTSFSAPKVSYIASRLQAEHPAETAQMYRALIIQSARLPEHCFHNPTMDHIRYYGYGIPDIERALNNHPKRITFVQNGHLGAKKADIYSINIPQELRGEAGDFSLLVEVTLAFTAKTRQTRKGAHSYLSTWLEWHSSKYNERFQSFRNRTIEYLEQEGQFDPGGEDGGAIKWCLRENPAWAENGINRNNSTVQKSWTTIQPHQFADNFNIAVIGHASWDRNLENEVPYALCISFEILGVETPIYQLMAEAQIQAIEQEQEVEAI